MFEDIFNDMLEDRQKQKFQKMITDIHQILGEFFFEQLNEDTLRDMMRTMGKYLKMNNDDYTMTGQINGKHVEIYVDFKDFDKEVTFII
jgi:hypothetical protein